MSSLSPAQWRGHQCSAGAKGIFSAGVVWEVSRPRQRRLFLSPGRTIPRPGCGRELPATSPRGNAPAGSGSCCSLFLFDLQRVWSPAGSLSWPQHCLITCSKGHAEEEAKLFPGLGGIRRGGRCVDPLGHEASSLGMWMPAWSQDVPGEVEWVPTRRWDNSEGGGIWDVHQLWVGWQRSGRAPESILVTSGKCFISAQLDSAPNPVHWAAGRRPPWCPARAWPGTATAALLAPGVRARRGLGSGCTIGMRSGCACFCAAKARSCTAPWAALSLSFPEGCAQATIPLQHSSSPAFF